MSASMSLLLIHYRAIFILRFLTKNPCHRPQGLVERALNSSYSSLLYSFTTIKIYPLGKIYVFSNVKVAVLTGNQTINERYDGASSFGIYEER